MSRLKQYAIDYHNGYCDWHLIGVTKCSYSNIKGLTLMNYDASENHLWNVPIPNSQMSERVSYIFNDHIDAHALTDNWNEEKLNCMRFCYIAHEFGHQLSNLSHANNANNYVHTEYHNMDDYGPLSNNNYYCLMGAGFPLYFDAGWKFSFCKPDYYLFVGKRDTDSHTCCFENFLSNFDEF